MERHGIDVDEALTAFERLADVGRLRVGIVGGVGVADPAVYVSAVALLIVVALGACAIPAWRAVRVNPVDALRAE